MQRNFIYTGSINSVEKINISSEKCAPFYILFNKLNNAMTAALINHFGGKRSREVIFASLATAKVTELLLNCASGDLCCEQLHQSSSKINL